MAAVAGAPQPFPYQGSKRLLAAEIVSCLPPGTRRIVEPFAGSGAVSIAAAKADRSPEFLINDLNGPLCTLWWAILNEPDELCDGYESLWAAQQGRERAFFGEVRARFNRTHEPADFLYLLARCVKAAVRYNSRGEFNNSPDNRRLGMRPGKMRTNIRSTSKLLRGVTSVSSQDYAEVLEDCDSGTFVYLDPPYQGVCGSRDPRYLSQIAHDAFAQALERLNARDVPYVISYDGRTGSRSYGEHLPTGLGLTRAELSAGRSSQSTLLGRSDLTVESLYLSRTCLRKLGGVPPILQQLTPS